MTANLVHLTYIIHRADALPFIGRLWRSFSLADLGNGHKPSAIDSFFGLGSHGWRQGLGLKCSLTHEGAEGLIQSEKNHRTLHTMWRLLVCTAVRCGAGPFVFWCQIQVVDGANDPRTKMTYHFV